MLVTSDHKVLISLEKKITPSSVPDVTEHWWNSTKVVVDNIPQNSKALSGILGCSILLARYMADLHSVNEISRAHGSVLVTIMGV